MKNNFKPEIIDFTVGGHDYTIEFNRESLREADSLGAFSNDSMGMLDRVTIALYTGLKKNHAFVTVKRAREIIDDAMDEGYSLDAFADVIDEMLRCYKAVFFNTDNPEKKLLVHRNSAKTQK